MFYKPKKYKQIVMTLLIFHPIPSVNKTSSKFQKGGLPFFN